MLWSFSAKGKAYFSSFLNMKINRAKKWNITTTIYPNKSQITVRELEMYHMVLYIYMNIGPFVHPKKVPPCSVSNILDSWLWTVTRIALSCRAIQAESNELFGVIIKCILSRYLERFNGTVFAVFLKMSSYRGCGRNRDICWSLTW